MKELPTPTLELSPLSLPRGALHPGLDATAPVSESKGGIEVAWARHQDEVREA